MPTTAPEGEEQRGSGLSFTVPVGRISAGRRYVSTYPARPGGGRTRRGVRPSDAAAPMRLTKKGALPLVSRVGGTRSAPVRSQTRKRQGRAAQINHEK